MNLITKLRTLGTAKPAAEERLPERRAGAHHVQVVRLLLGVAHEVALGVLLVVALVHDGDHGADGHLALGAALDDLGVLDEVLELADAALHVALLVLRGVVVAVLRQVAEQAGGQVHDHAFVQLHQPGECLRVAGAAGGDELALGDPPR